MDVNLDTIVQAATPWYLRHWQSIAFVVTVAVLGGFIVLQHHEISAKDEQLETAKTTLVKITAEYKSDVEKLKAATAVQNAAVDILHQAGEDAAVRVQNATTKSNEIRSATDKQVMTILSAPKETSCDKSIGALVDGVADLQWSAIK